MRRRQNETKKDQRERKAEQESDMRRADGAERRGEPALHGIAQRLADRGQYHKWYPQLRDALHVMRLVGESWRTIHHRRLRRSTRAQVMSELRLKKD